MSPPTIRIPTLILSLLAFALFPTTHAFFSMNCPNRIVRERLDPIVNPGAIAGHVHSIVGGSSFSKSMTYEDARASKCSSCPIKEDLSNYWTPQLYTHLPNGTYTPVPLIGDPSDRTGGMTIYYLQRPGSHSPNLTAFPPGFRMLAGTSSKRAPSFLPGTTTPDFPTQGISYACLGSNRPETNAIPNYPCPGGLRAQIFFPSCWNGHDLDSPDHRSHMAYPIENYNGGNCPDTHPVQFISLFYEVLYDVARFNDQWPSPTSHPFVFANGDATGYGFHGDFVNGWDTAVLQSVIDTCTDPGGNLANCHAVTLFSGEEMRNCRIPVTVDERVDGVLAKLPGCNDPEEKGCVDSTTWGPGPVNYVDRTAEGWAYRGCATDAPSARAFTNASTTADDMTVEKCISFCDGSGLGYAGLEYSKECFCADRLSVKDGPKEGVMGRCEMSCGGDSDQICGGSGWMSVYGKCEVGGECKNVGDGSRVKRVARELRA